jgi:hypothetical protein
MGRKHKDFAALMLYAAGLRAGAINLEAGHNVLALFSRGTGSMHDVEYWNIMRGRARARILLWMERERAVFGCARG